MESVPQSPDAGEFRRRSYCLNYRVVCWLCSSPPVHHDSPAVHCADLRPMRWCSQTGDQTSSREHSRLELVNTNFLEATLKSRISLFLLTLALALPSTLTAH